MSTLTVPLSTKSGHIDSILMFDSTNIEPSEFHSSVQKYLSSGSVREETLILNTDDGANYQTLIGSSSHPLTPSMKDVIFTEPDNNMDINQLYFLITPEENPYTTSETLPSLSNSAVLPSFDGVSSSKNEPLIAVLDVNYICDESPDNFKSKKYCVSVNQESFVTAAELKENLPLENLKVLSTEDKLSQRDLLLPIHSHTGKRTSKRTITCDKCKLVFNSPIQYYSHRNAHLQDQNGKMVWSCAQCGMEFKGRSKLKSHELQDHGEVRLYPCPHCVHSFPKPLLLDYHIRNIHHGEKQFKCKVCGQEFFRSYDLKMHLNIHFNIKHHLCQFCGRQFNHPSNLHRHQRSHTNVKPYLCNICGRRFSQMPSLLAHRVSHTSGGYCSECKANFRSIAGLRNHMKTAHEKSIATKELNNIFYKNSQDNIYRLYNCIICAERFRFKKELLKHEKIAHSNKPFPCKSCCKIFPCIKGLKSHACVMTKSNMNIMCIQQPALFSGTYECVNCHQIFGHCQESENHVCAANNKSSEKDKEYKIELTKEDSHEETLLLCINTDEDGKPMPSLSGWVTSDTSMTTNSSVESVVNQTSPKDNFPSENTSKTSKGGAPILVSVPKKERKKCKKQELRKESKAISHTDKERVRSQRKGKNNSNKILECKYCGKTFSKSWNWQQHSATHDASLRKYSCAECGESFSYRSTYTNHLKTHCKLELNEKYHCSQCPKVYKTRSSLSQHKRRIHDMQRNYTCTLCPRGFFSKCEFAYHMRKHKNELIYLCHVCGEEFSHVSHLYRHEKIHTGERPHKCPYCPKSFIQAVTLRIHLKKHDVRSIRMDKEDGEDTVIVKNKILAAKKEDAIAIINLEEMTVTSHTDHESVTVESDSTEANVFKLFS